MTTDSIKLGETYDIQASALDADDAPVVLDGSWLVACRVCKGKTGGETLLDVPMTIIAGVATGQIDTKVTPWVMGTYYLDIRFTDPSGNDYWSDPWRLEVGVRNTPSSAGI